MKGEITRLELLRKNIPELDIALHINKSNLEHIEFLENKIIELEKRKEKVYNDSQKLK